MRHGAKGQRGKGAKGHGTEYRGNKGKTCEDEIDDVKVMSLILL